MNEEKLLLYTDFDKDEVFYDMSWLIENRGASDLDAKKTSVFYKCMHKLIEFAGTHGFYGNIWHCYLANLLVNSENTYSKACEIRGRIEGTVNKAALHDISIFKYFFDYDFLEYAVSLGIQEYEMIENYESNSQESKVYNKRICRRICELADKFKIAGSAEDMKDTLTDFYKDYGVGKFGLHKSFRIVRDNNGVHIEPILNIAHVYLDDLIGYDIAKKKLIDNTDAFVAGRGANNCLLYGDAGTGKSSSIKAIANEYYEKGLRIIECYKHQFQDLNEVIAQIKNRNYKFIIYMDDLSFEDFEIEYKYLKAVIEGGLEKKPENVLIYATSNRRHLVREKFSDKEERQDDLHRGDTVQEKLSLVARFGVTIYFGAPDKKEFQNIVRALAKRYRIQMDEEELLLEANKWEIAHGGLSGRTAQQFMDYLLGQQEV